MNEKINGLLKNKRTLIVAVAFVVAIGGYMSVSRTRVPVDVGAEQEVDAPTIAVIENNPVTNSWPGEIISSKITQIQPQREGVITDWRVRIGEIVSAGEVLGKISAPPATPELIAMLAEKAEGLARARAAAEIADEFAVKTQQRLDTMNDALAGKTTIGVEPTLAALKSMREKLTTKRDALRSFIERALTRHVVLISSAFDWRYFRSGSLSMQYGTLNRNVQSAYELALITLAQKLKSANEVPITEAQNYFALFTQLASNSLDDGSADAVKMAAPEDQKDFFEMLSDYKMAQVEVADKETEYKLMVSENGAMVAKERSMAHAEVAAMEASYNTIAREINGGSYIIASRDGIVSAIYKKVGDLVNPTMSIAMIAPDGSDGLIARIQIPNNVKKPMRGEIVTIVRPGFPNDTRQAKIIGVGSSLNEMGLYMADTVFIDKIDWPIGASVRALAAANANIPTVEQSSVWQDRNGVNNIWGISEAGRIFAKKIEIGRTMGSLIEVYNGLQKGDRYMTNPTPGIHEDMLVDDIAKTKQPENGTVTTPMKSGGHESMPGM